MTEYTPTTDDVFDATVYTWVDWKGVYDSEEAAREGFNRWLARVRAEAQIEALMGFVADVTDQVALTDKAEGNEWASEDYRHGLRSALMQVVDRADRIAREAGIEQEES